jgi:zinc protease
MIGRARALHLRPLKVPPDEVHTLASGLTVHLVPRGQLPLVAVRLVIRAGSAFDPPGRLGVADFAARLCRRGAGDLTADQINDTVEYVGASLGGFANEENVVMALSTPSAHLRGMLEVFAKVVLAPEFPEAELELARRRHLASLANDLDDPGSLADRALGRAVWGDHPYGHEAVSGRADVERLTRDDLLRVHQERLGPRVAHLYVIGAFEPRQTLRWITAAFGGWCGGPEAPPAIPAWAGLPHAGEVVIVDKPDQTQVQVRVGAVGVRRGHADHFPLTLVNTTLGGGFTSRLVTQIRVKRGLSYGAGCAFEMLSGAGTFGFSSFTRTASVPTLLDVALGEIELMRERGPSARELATVQRYICGLYPGRLETNEAVAGALADVVHYGLDGEWIQSYRERISAVTVKTAARAAREHLFQGPARVVVLVGKASQLQKPAARFGPVRVLRPADLE